MTDKIPVDELVLSETTVVLSPADYTTYPATAESAVVTINEGVATQTANPKRASVRTTVQAVVGILVVLVPLLNIVLANVIDYLRVQTDLEVSPLVFVILNAALAITAFVIGLVSRVMNTPGVTDWIKAHLPFLAPIPLKPAAEVYDQLEAANE